MLKTISIIFRVILFYVLLWIRVPVALILQAVTSLSAMAFVVMLIVRGWSNAIDVFGRCWHFLLVLLFCAGFMTES